MRPHSRGLRADGPRLGVPGKHHRGGGTQRRFGAAAVAVGEGGGRKGDPGREPGGIGEVAGVE